MNILKMMGLMRVSEHEGVANANKGLLRDVINLRADLRIRDRVIGDLNDMVDSNREDALAWREKKRKDADYETNRRVRKTKGEK